MILEELKNRWWKRIMENNLEHEKITIRVRGLKPEEAIGRPARTDYPILKGREVMIQAEISGAYGQAFTDEPSNYEGSLISVYSLPLVSNKNRALLVAAINATYRYLGLVTHTRHCKDDGPEICGRKIAEHLATKLPPQTKIVMIGFQPAIAYYVSRRFRNFRVTDMDFDNIGRIKEGTLIESYMVNKEAILWGDVVLATGSTIVNGSIEEIVNWSKGKQLIFYGMTISAAAYEFTFNQLCYESS
ncbi:MAG: DUF364 domain-containing protein [Nitrososphaerales archaeon]